MDALKQQLLKVQQQLAGLTASQKMLTASLLVIMVMTLFYWSKFASVSELEAVIDHALTAEEMANVKTAVSEQNVTYEIRNDRIYVPASKKAQVDQAMSTLALNGKLPEAYNKAADDADDKGTFLEPPAARDQRQQDRRRRRVEDMIRRWPEVKDVSVILTGEKRVGILNPEHPTASVSLTFAGGARETKKIVDAARLQVAHIQSGLKAEDVAITVNGHAFKSDDGFGGDEILAAKSDNERHYAQNIADQCGIEGLKVKVNIKLDTKRSVINTHDVDSKNKVSAPLRENTSTEENSTPAPAGEPGVTANVGIAAEQQAAAGHTSSVEKSETTNQVDTGYKNAWIESGPGEAVASSAAVGVPESYYRRLWKHLNPKDAREPTSADIKPLIPTEEGRIRENVKNVTGISDDKLVSVGTYFDFEPTPVADAGAAAGLATIPMSTGFGAKEIAVGALAVISLFMVSMMVRKSVPQPVLAAAATAPMPEPMAGMLSVHDLAGEVGEANLTLTGQELSDEAIEAKQVIEQVGTMVKDNPDVAANLVKRWLNQD